MAEKKLKQKKHCNRIMIPEKDIKDYLIPKTGADIFKLSLKNIKFIHPYCLTISKSYAKYMSEEMQLAFTPQQLVYIPDTSMVEFTEHFFDVSIKEAKKHRDELYEVDYIYLYDDGSTDLVTEQTTLLDKLWRVKAMAQTQKKAYELKAIARMKKDESTWQSTDSVPERRLSDILDMSPAAVRKFFADCITNTSKRNYAYSYSKILDILAKKTIVSPTAGNDILSECKSYFEIENGEIKYKALPLLYQQKIIYEGLGLIFKKINPEIPPLSHEICQENGFMLVFDEMGQKGFRYIRSDLELLREDPRMKEKIIDLYEDFGLEFDKEKHQLPY